MRACFAVEPKRRCVVALLLFICAASTHAEVARDDAFINYREGIGPTATVCICRGPLFEYVTRSVTSVHNVLQLNVLRGLRGRGKRRRSAA